MVQYRQLKWISGEGIRQRDDRTTAEVGRRSDVDSEKERRVVP